VHSGNLFAAIADPDFNAAVLGDDLQQLSLCGNKLKSSET